ncbi:MAG: hypothetical protein ISP01_07155 [Methanobrevibacter arboriphilus]|uniref:Uncharacterized protein n=1 Tax=Methanobrevibacter arboriphilus TaxID=39441 RepID=A0A843ANT6_METAZ|nr:hypothetical protein [Methanobrevibacter arboriphilus]MBF4469168.1 hypothetical protein [Methanobrevibacter arboriphilus]
MIKHPKWAKRLVSCPILPPNLETGESIVLVTVKMKHITKEQANELKKYLEEGSGKKLTLLNWDYYGDIRLYEKNSMGLVLRFRLE